MKYFSTNKFDLLPSKAGDAGIDLRCVGNVVVYPNQITKINTGIYLEIPDGFVGIIKDRSSVGIRGGHIVGGVVDSNYRGEIIICMTSLVENEVFFEEGDKVAQIVILPYYVCNELIRVGCVNDLSVTSRNDKGFGSSGK